MPPFPPLPASSEILMPPAAAVCVSQTPGFKLLLLDGASRSRHLAWPRRGGKGARYCERSVLLCALLLASGLAQWRWRMGALLGGESCPVSLPCFCLEMKLSITKYSEL